MSSKMLPIITEEIANLEVSKNTYYKTQFCLPIYKDLQSVLQWRDNVERSMSLYPFYTEQYKTELLMWYRKLMEHFYYTFLLKDLPEEGYHLYILYKDYDFFRERANACKKVYKIDDTKNIYLSVLSKKLQQIGVLEQGHTILLDTILKTKDKWVGLKNISNSPFLSLDQLHKKVFDGANNHERMVIGGRNYQALYGLLSYKVHSNPIQGGMLADEDFKNFIARDGLLNSIVYFIGKNLGLKLPFNGGYTQDEYDDAFIKSFQSGTMVNIPPIIRAHLTIIEKIMSLESEGYALYMVEINGKQYIVPADELYPI